MKEKGLRKKSFTYFHHTGVVSAIQKADFALHVFGLLGHLDGRPGKLAGSGLVGGGLVLS